MGQQMFGGTAKRASKVTFALPLSLVDRISQWFSLWELAGFEQHITISFSSRLHRALGRCYAKRRRISVAAHLKDENYSLLEEVLCHECAHMAASELHGPKCRPHGPEWAQLMRSAGFEPRRRLVDFTRLSVYGTHFSRAGGAGNLPLFATATLCAFLGAFIGSRFMKKVTMRAIQVMVAIMLLGIAVGLGSG